MGKLRPSLGSLQHWTWSLCLGSVIAGAAAFALLPSTSVYAAALPKVDNIRVALFIETGKYSDTTPAVTLSSDKGLDAGFTGGKSKAGAALALTSGNQQVKAALEAYRALLLESADAAQVKAAAAKLTAAKEDSLILKRDRQGKPVYQLLSGPYTTKEAAAAAVKKASMVTSAADTIAGFAPRVTGPLHWNAGVFASEDAAAAQAVVISQAGFEADVAYLETADGTAYAVLTSSASDAAELSAAKQQINAALPSVALQPVDAAQTYALKRKALDKAAVGIVEQTQLMLGGGGSGKLTVSSKAGSTIKVEERSARSYRGSIELSQLNGKLAVINELPFEQYLVSVVSSELSKDWPLEALKAQAVAARTYALKQGVKYQIAHVTDTTLDQAYKGAAVEFASASDAVQGTEGEVLADQGGLISPLFYSNAGGLTADSSEVWGNKVDYLKSVATPDEGAEKGKAVWYRIVLPNGNMGYIHSNYARDTGKKNAAGLPYYEATDTGVSVRSAPYVDNSGNPALFKVDIGDRFVVFDQAVESNAYSWIRGPYEGDKLKDKINGALAQPIAGAIDHLEVSERGPSGRAIQVKANGQVVKTSYPDALRTLFNSLPSTRFDIEETGRYTILGANGTVRSQSPAMPVVYLNGSSASTAEPVSGSQMFVLNGSGQVRATDKESTFIFKGTGFGHGLGMSQWGAKGYAELGYDYKKILQTYYVGVSIIKE
ncbi:SpoIID/LytB domain-containing protein [Paenibacillus rigui]|uniref:Stage II sporulation protein SpoIID n=1 Tax=Paenibacillus rigui TaxID=554312 RepID=A0A229UV96_9BACL|nr:SpoIID/LytB domain-containing protein [Paenibacillus rigui]OXM86829.1 stage II sporulation protein SpoIID [Paenibacillus rigui]